MPNYFKNILLSLHASVNYLLFYFYISSTLLILSPGIAMEELKSTELSHTHSLAEKILHQSKSDDYEDTRRLDMMSVKVPTTNENFPLLLPTSEMIAEQQGGNSLVTDNNPFFPFVYYYILRNKQIEENTWIYRIRLGVRALSILYGIMGGVPYISASCSAGQGFDFLCIPFVTGNLISTGATMVWAGLRLTNALNPASKEEKEIVHSSLFCNIIKHLTCNALGILVSVPGTYAVFKYNSSFYKALVIPGFLNSYILSTLGYYELTTHAYLVQPIVSKFQEYDEIDKRSQELKEKLKKHIDSCVIPEIIKKPEARVYLFSASEPVDNNSTVRADTEVKNFMNKILTLDEVIDNSESPETWRGGYPRKVTKYSSLILPFGSAIVNYLLTYELSYSLTQSTLFSIIFSVVAVIPGFVLDTLLTTTTATTIFDTIYNKVKKRNKADFTSLFYPNLNRVIPYASVMLASLSVTASWFVAYDTIGKSSISFLVYVLPTMVYITNTIFQSFSIRDLFSDVLNYVSTFLAGEKRDVAHKIGKLEKLKTIICDSASSIFYKFWSKVKEE